MLGCFSAKSSRKLMKLIIGEGWSGEEGLNSRSIEKNLESALTTAKASHAIVSIGCRGTEKKNFEWIEARGAFLCSEIWILSASSDRASSCSSSWKTFFLTQSHSFSLEWPANFSPARVCYHKSLTLQHEAEAEFMYLVFLQFEFRNLMSMLTYKWQSAAMCVMLQYLV